MEAWLADLRLAGRLLWRDAAHSLAAVLALALGAGTTVAVFSLAAGVLFRPLPYEEAHQLVRVETTNPRTGWIMSVPLKDLGELRSRCSSLSDMAALLLGRASLRGGQGAEALRVMFVTSGFPSMHRHPALIGRTLAPGDFTPGGPSAAVLSHAFWQKHFGGKASALGKTLSIRTDYPGKGTQAPVVLTAVGVMPQGFPIEGIPGPRRSAAPVDMWIPVEFGRSIPEGRFAHTIARLRDGATLQQAQDELKRAGQELAAAKSRDYDRKIALSLRLVPLREHVVGPTAPKILSLLMGASLLLLAACCANGRSTRSGGTAIFILAESAGWGMIFWR